jgi:hypothetical protein
MLSVMWLKYRRQTKQIKYLPGESKIFWWYFNFNAESVHTVVLWILALYGLGDGHHCFGGTFYFYPQGRRFYSSITFHKSGSIHVKEMRRNTELTDQCKYIVVIQERIRENLRKIHNQELETVNPAPNAVKTEWIRKGKLGRRCTSIKQVIAKQLTNPTHLLSPSSETNCDSASQEITSIL